MKLLVLISFVFPLAAIGQQSVILVAKKQPFVTQPVEKDHYKQGLGFFCRKELQVEQKTKIPVKLRVGSIEQCNYLEQKPGYTIPRP